MDPPALGRAVLLLGLVAILRASCFSGLPARLDLVLEPVPLHLEDLSGAEFRLLPGVGPVLAERLEAARLARGGRLDRAAAAAVYGVGEVLLARWAELDPGPARSR